MQSRGGDNDKGDLDIIVNEQTYCLALAIDRYPYSLNISNHCKNLSSSCILSI